MRTDQEPWPHFFPAASSGKDLDDAGIVVDVSGQQDSDAMHAGQAFAEIAEPDEEWVGWVDWELVTGGVGGST